MALQRKPGPASFEELTRPECEAILARHSVGRIAYSFHDRVDIEPIHYVFGDGWLYGRTSEGAKLTAVDHSRWVALEVDEVDGPFEWRSVVVKGALYRLTSDLVTEVEFDRALQLLRSVAPEMGTDEDPGAFRKVLFRIHVDEITGRKARPPAASR